MKATLKYVGKIFGYLADRIFSSIIMGVAFAVVLAWLIENGYLNLGG